MTNEQRSRELALRHSATCFFNSIAREWSEVSLTDAPEGLAAPKALRLPLEDGETLFVPVTGVSLVGRHRYGRGFFVQRGDRRREISFDEAVAAVTARLALEFGTSDAQSRRFLDRVANSVDNIAATLAVRGLALAGLHQHSRVDFRSAEQSLFVGHNFHPTPKSRDEFSAADFKAYSSEMGGEFRLGWFLAKPEALFVQKAAAFRDDGFARDLFLQAFPDRADLRALLNDGYEPLPVHPWQRLRLLERADVRSLLERRLVVDAGPAGETWAATTSTRSVYNPRAKYMLKFSMSVRLTNSLRHLLPAEVVRGLQVYDVFATDAGRRFQTENPRFHVLFEPAFAALKNGDGGPMVESIVVWRENPFRETTRFQDVVLATLVQDHPSFGENLLLGNVRRLSEETGETLRAAATRWFDAYLDVVVDPLVKAQSRYGVLMGAHQQNLVLRLENHLPVASFFRDCQGTGYSRRGFELFAKDVELLSETNGNILDGVSGNTLFAYYLIVNSTFNVVASLASHGWISETDLLKRLRRRLLALKNENPTDTSCLEALLAEPTILQKGNFLCAFRGVNENTSENPLALYDRIANPLATVGDDVATETPLSPFGPVAYRAPVDEIERRVSFDGSNLFVIEDGRTLIARVEARDGGATVMFHEKTPDLSVLTAVEALLGHNENIARIRLEGSFGDLVNRLFRGDGGFSLSRGEFFQIPQLWLPRNVLDLNLEKWTVTNDVSHPLRPRREGLLYRRYVPRLGKTLSYRMLGVDRDLDVFHAWQTQPRVAQFWELDQPKEILAEFLRKTLSDRHTLPTILEFDGEPVGYFELYWVSEDRLAPYCDARDFDRGFHLLVGNEKYLGFRNTDAALKSVTHLLLLDDPRTRTLWAEPRADNAGVLKYLETFKAWNKVKEFDFPHKRSALLECRRQDFFGGNFL